MFASRNFRLASLFACVVMAFSMISVDQAEARRGGSFGSRGTRTFQAPAQTNTAPAPTTPVQRSMTPNQQQTNAASPAANAAQPRGFMNGLGGNLLRGLMLGGLIGMLLGGGFGGMGGILAMLAQVALIGGVIWLVMRFMRSRSPQAATAAGPDVSAYQAAPNDAKPDNFFGNFGGSGAPKAAPFAKPSNPNELNIGQEDLEIFESMLTRVQAAFSKENYTALRALTTPEIMGYLSEELGNNATNGVRNEVSDVKLLQGDLAESWREGNTEYATAAMRYSAIDVTRDRATGKVVEGDADQPTESTELWTFTRPVNGQWLLSAIQEA
jgi:predicted lipid-binding transport protein (Tim44 family)